MTAKLDLLVKGGRVIDPANGTDEVLDIAVRRGRITAVGEGLEQRLSTPGFRQVIDATGGLVVPGLIDIHTHVYTGVCPLTVLADEVASRSGVTTMVSAGDAGANTIEGFRQLIVNQSRTRVLALLHISTTGLATFPVGESIQMDLLDVEAAEVAISRFPEMIVGLKVRQGGPGVTGSNGLEPLRRAIAVGIASGLPVMVHITDFEAPIGDLLSMLSEGDIVTHCFTGSPNGLRQDGEIAPAARAARERGVLFDVGHGAGSFDFEVAEAAARVGFWPDTISTDIHSMSAAKVTGLPDVMSKLLAVGMPLENVIAAATNNAARAIGLADSLGTLREGAV
ncbi:MAG: amidohydrolase family protein, partial [Candidatus Dormibacteraeota bacterium]|nr:amidohydrolase family protein [Candidatus Dormibacteraeota bacterium]